MGCDHCEWIGSKIEKKKNDNDAGGNRTRNLRAQREANVALPLSYDTF